MIGKHRGQNRELVRAATSGKLSAVLPRIVCCRALGVFASLLLLASAARARGLVQVPAECGSSEELTQELKRLLGNQAAQGEPISLHISPRNALNNHSLRLELKGEVRELHDPDCRALFQSAIIIAAAAVRPDLYDAPPLSSEETPAPTNPESPSAKSSLPQQAKHQPAHDEAPWRASVHAGAGAAAGLLPGVAPLVAWGGTLSRGSWGVVGALRYLSGTESSKQQERGVRVWALGGQLAGSFEPLDLLRFTAGLTFHRLEGEGFGVSQPMTDSAWSVSPTLEAMFIPFHTRDLQVELGLQAHVSVMRPRFEIGGFGEIYRMPPFGGAALIRLGWWML